MWWRPPPRTSGSQRARSARTRVGSPHVPLGEGRDQVARVLVLRRATGRPYWHLSSYVPTAPLTNSKTILYTCRASASIPPAARLALQRGLQHLVRRFRHGLRHIQYHSPLRDGCLTQTGLTVQPAWSAGRHPEFNLSTQNSPCDGRLPIRIRSACGNPCVLGADVCGAVGASDRVRAAEQACVSRRELDEDTAQ